MESIELRAPAKVNLFLRVLSKRSDSYHNIFTLFERISLADKIIISKIPRGIVVSSDKFITHNPRHNLVYRAARLMLGYKGMDKGRKGVEKGVRIRIEKRIPIAAGLGGGSSDAASALIGIDRLYGLKLKQDKLLSIAKQLGADVPFFVLDTAFAIGRSRGDELEAMGRDSRLWHLIINPGFKVATKEIYEAYDEIASSHDAIPHAPRNDRGGASAMMHSRSLRGTKCRSNLFGKYLTTKNRDVRINFHLEDLADFDALESMLHNDLEDIVVAKKEGIGTIIERLASSLGKKAILSGSGPSVFCLYGTRKEAITAKKVLLESAPPALVKGWQIFIAGTQ